MQITCVFTVTCVIMFGIAALLLPPSKSEASVSPATPPDTTVYDCDDITGYQSQTGPGTCWGPMIPGSGEHWCSKLEQECELHVFEKDNENNPVEYFFECGNGPGNNGWVDGCPDGDFTVYNHD